MSERVQTLLLDARRYQDSIISLAEIHRPGVIAMLIRHQRCVLSKVFLMPQVPNHGDTQACQGITPVPGWLYMVWEPTRNYVPFYP